MIISKIQMVNFRAFSNKVIEFGNKTVVLLSAANGVGKTTTIDAIEWCLTGDIYRLKKSFTSRSTNNDERKLNTSGILKNRDASSKSIVKVILWIWDNEKEIVICREQKKDELDSKASTVTIDGDEDKAKIFINQYIGKSFYNFHFCDIQKAFNFQSTKRRDLEDFFSEFITNYDEQKQVVKNIDNYINDLDCYINEKKEKRIDIEKAIMMDQGQLKEVQEEKHILYPKAIFYVDEKTDILGMSRKQLVDQKAEINNCGYLIIKEKLSELILNEELKKQKEIIERINSILITKEGLIRKAIEAGLHKNVDLILKDERRLSVLDKLYFTKDTIFKDLELVFSCENDELMRNKYEDDKKSIKEMEKKIKELSSEINNLSKNNKLLKALSNLSANRYELIEYRNNAIKQNKRIRCPICGSESFFSMEQEMILKEADDYIRQNGEVVKAKEVEKAKLQADVEEFYQKIISSISDRAEKEKIQLENRIKELNVLKNETQVFFDTVMKLQKIKGDITPETITVKKCADMISEAQKGLLDESKEKESKELYQKILTVLGYDYESETIQETYAKVNNLITRIYDVSNFSYEIYVSKLNAIESALTNQTISSLNKKMEDNREKEQKLDSEIKNLEKLKKKARDKSEKIRTIVEELSKDEYKKIGPALEKFYNKLIRFDLCDGIHIVPEKEGISLVDNGNKNIVNILSNGQISVFILAYFFAAISVRNKYEKMKVFFIDDLTACMDDVNMLAFMDILKYQMSSKGTMNQLFFVTCDNRISELFKYKLEGRQIDICELSETDIMQIEN